MGRYFLYLHPWFSSQFYFDFFSYYWNQIVISEIISFKKFLKKFDLKLNLPKKTRYYKIDKLGTAIEILVHIFFRLAIPKGTNW